MMTITFRDVNSNVEETHIMVTHIEVTGVHKDIMRIYFKERFGRCEIGFVKFVMNLEIKG